jgi:hypothetical protein
MLKRLSRDNDSSFFRRDVSDEGKSLITSPEDGPRRHLRLPQKRRKGGRGFVGQERAESFEEAKMKISHSSEAVVYKVKSES